MSMLTAAFDHLSSADWASMGSQAQGEVLAGLRGAQARLIAVQARVLAAFTAAGGYEPDGHGSARQWLIGKTRVSKGAANGAMGWSRRLGRHGVIASAMAAGSVSESWARQIADWTDPLPQAERDSADQILLEAAAGGLPLEDLGVLAQAVHETWKAQHPDPDNGNDGDGDEDGFEDRHLRLGTTFGGAGTLRGDLTAHCAAALQAIFDSLGKHLGPDDTRTVEQRQHDALADALQRLIKADLLPESAGQATMAQVLIPFGALRSRPGASQAEQEWIAKQVGRPGWLSGIGAEAAACDAAVVPVITGTVDWQAVDAMADLWIDAYGLEHARGCTCKPRTPMPPETKARLREALLAMAADAMSGPGGLASYLRTRLLQVPYSSSSLPLDVGKTKDIPDHIRRAVILRDRHCAWPGGCDKPPAACECHHLVPRSQGGKTSVGNLKLLCDYHHQVLIHRLGWKLIAHPDGRLDAISPNGKIVRSHGPPTARAG
jgi:hypothetical protein